MRFVFGVILLIFLGAVGVFALQNTQSVAVRFLNWSVSAPLALLSIAVYFLGMISGWSVVGFLRSSLSRVTEDPR